MDRLHSLDDVALSRRRRLTRSEVEFNESVDAIIAETKRKIAAAFDRHGKIQVRRRQG